MSAIPSLPITIEQIALLEEALSKIESGMATLATFPVNAFLVPKTRAEGEGLIATYQYLLSCPRLEPWMLPSWLPHATQFLRNVDLVREYNAETK